MPIDRKQQVGSFSGPFQCSVTSGDPKHLKKNGRPWSYWIPRYATTSQPIGEMVLHYKMIYKTPAL
jgi:hypothetical protein